MEPVFIEKKTEKAMFKKTLFFSKTINFKAMKIILENHLKLYIKSSKSESIP